MSRRFEELERRIRARANALWEREGRPEGRADAHWELASEEIAIEDNLAGTLKPDPVRGPDDRAEREEPVEPVLSLETQGDMPGLADQGEEFSIPKRPGPKRPGPKRPGPKQRGASRPDRDHD